MPKTQSKSSRGEPAEESLEVGAVDDGSVGAAPSGESKDPVNMNDIASMMQICLQFQRDLGEKLEKETIKQDKRWRQLQIQVNNIRDDMEQQRNEGVPSQSATPELPHEDEQPSFSGAETRPGARGWGQAVVPRLEEEDDIEQYLTTFERLAVAYQWPEMEWAVRLVPHLTGKARAAYVAMAAGDSLDYRSVKEAILAKYAINEDVYRQRFREPDVRPNESPKEFYNRLKDLYHKWIQPAKRNKQEIEEIFILEQFYRCLSPELRVWVREREPKSAKEAAFLVETFLAARRGPKSFRFEPTQKSSAIRGKPSVTGGGGGGPGEAESVRPTEKPSNLNKARTAMPVCFYCGQEGHIKPNCPVRKAKTAYFCTVPRPSQTENKVVGKRQVVTAKINNKVVEALLDTGSVQTLIHPSLLNDRAILGRTVLDISCVHGDHKSYPIAVVYLEIAGQTFLMSVGVVDSLAYPVILGQDLPILQELVGNCKPVNIVTRSQKRTQNLTQEIETEKGPVSMRQSGEEIYRKDAPDVTNSLSELPFFDVILPEQNVKMRKTRAQKRKEKMLGTIRKNCSYQEPEVPKCDEIDFLQLQHKDTSLQGCFRNAEVEQGRVADRGFFLRDKVLYYKDNQDDYARLVVPQQLREQVLHLGHSIPWAGHLGTKKTLDRVASRFYWPGLNTDVQNFCQSCSVCQLASDKNVPKYPLQPLPIIDVPFSRIAMDIVGPLERTQSGNRYILVICDYGTRYPEAFPLRDITAKQIAYALLQFFSRVGIPSEILTDQGTNFLSNTLKQVYRLLGIKGIRTTAYHPQTDGLVERYNRTLKSMLKKFISMNAKDWDKWLPYLLFAYREVPQASTGFSPFELLYGRQVRGPLDVLQEAWVGAQTKKTSVLEFVLQMREKMEQTTRLVRKQLEKAQHTQQTWYDKSARQRSFNPGQQVLLLLPTAENKLLAKWQGPYTVLRKLSPTTYEIEMPERRDPKQTFHINLLKEWKTRDMPSQQQLFVRTVEEEDEYDFTPSNENFASLDLSHLSLKQQEELQAIIPEGLFQEKPGATDLVEHNIHLKNANPIRQKMYRIPQRLVPILEEEITVMKELKTDWGGQRTLQRKWTTFLKARIVCSVPEYELHVNILRDVFVLNGRDAQSSIFYGIFGLEWKNIKASAVCQYAFSDVHKVFEGPYMEVQDAKWREYTGKVPEPRPGSCITDLHRSRGINSSRDLPDNVLTFARRHPLMANQVHPIGMRPLMFKRNVNYVKIVVHKEPALDGKIYTILFLGTDNGWLHRAVDIDGEMHIIEELQLFNTSQPIESMVISSVQRSIYVGSHSGVVQVPMSACRRYTSCYDCVFAKDPFCGWDGRVCVEISSRLQRSNLTQDITRGIRGCKENSGNVVHRRRAVMSGDDVLLQCELRSNLATPHWTLNGKELLGYGLNSGYRIGTDGLLIIGARTQQSGSYRCFAVENSVSVLVYLYTVKVHTDPFFPVEPTETTIPTTISSSSLFSTSSPTEQPLPSPPAPLHPEVEFQTFRHMEAVYISLVAVLGGLCLVLTVVLLYVSFCTRRGHRRKFPQQGLHVLGSSDRKRSSHLELQTISSFYNGRQGRRSISVPTFGDFNDSFLQIIPGEDDMSPGKSPPPAPPLPMPPPLPNMDYANGLSSTLPTVLRKINGNSYVLLSQADPDGMSPLYHSFTEELNRILEKRKHTQLELQPDESSI